MKYVLGIDPGQSGGMVYMEIQTGDIIDRLAFSHGTGYDTVEWLSEWVHPLESMAFLEKVHSMPKQGVASSFKFGESFGFLQGILTGRTIPYQFVTPQKWQKAMGCLTGGNKNISKGAAQRLWPHLRWTHALSDAALIAEYGRRTLK